MSVEDKQKYLRESIINDGMDTESFIEFMDADKERGADLAKYTFEEVKKKVKEFKATNPKRHTMDESKGDLLKGAKLPDNETPKPNAIQEKNNLTPTPKEKPKVEKKAPAPKVEDPLDSPRNGDEDELDVKDRKLEADDDLDKDSKYYGRKDCVKLEPTELVTDQEVTVTLYDLAKVKAGAPKGDATIYVLETAPFGWKVNRQFKDFQWLYKCLNGRYPANYVIASNIRFLHFQRRNRKRTKTRIKEKELPACRFS